MKCPTCGSQDFYVKNPKDMYEMYYFTFKDGKIIFQNSESDPPEIDEQTEIYCDACAWHGKMRELKP